MFQSYSMIHTVWLILVDPYPFDPENVDSKNNSPKIDSFEAIFNWRKTVGMKSGVFTDIKSNASQKDIKSPIRSDFKWSKQWDLWVNRVGELGNFISFWDAYDFRCRRQSSYIHMSHPYDSFEIPERFRHYLYNSR